MEEDHGIPRAIPLPRSVLGKDTMDWEEVYRRTAEIIKRQRSLLPKGELKKLGVCETNKHARRRQRPQSLREDAIAQFQNASPRQQPLNLREDSFRAVRKEFLTITIKTGDIEKPLREGLTKVTEYPP